MSGSSSALAGKELQVYKSTEEYVTVTGCTTGSGGEANGIYTRVSMENDKPQYKKAGTPYFIRIKADHTTWEIYEDGQAALANQDSGTNAGLPYSPRAGTWSADSCVVSAHSAGGTDILTGSSASVSASVVVAGEAPSFSNVISTTVQTVGNREIHRVILDATAADITGQFELKFDNSHKVALMSYDEPAEDFATKIESLGTVGSVDVLRKSTTNGYEWVITYIDNTGDVPLLVSSNPAANALSGTGLNLTIKENLAGSPVSMYAIAGGLTTGREYYARVSAANSAGYGDYTTAHQSSGEGVVPFSHVVRTVPAAPEVTLASLSSSQIDVKFTTPSSEGSDIELYKIEWTSDSSFSGGSVRDSRTIRVRNTQKNDILGFFKLAYGGESTTPLTVDSTASEVEAALEALTTIGDVIVTDNNLYVDVFDGSNAGIVDTAADTVVISSVAYGLLEDGDSVTYTKGVSASTVINGLTEGATYYVKKIAPDKVKFYETRENAIADTLKKTIASVGGGTSHAIRFATRASLVKQWDVIFVQDVGQLGDLTVDNSALYSESTLGTISGTVENVTTTAQNPTNYGFDYMIADTSTCGSTVIGTSSSVQKIVLRATDAAVSSGTYKLSLDGQETGCIAYNAAASVIQTALNNLVNVENDVIVKATAIPANEYGFPFEYTVYFKGEYPSGEWPTLRKVDHAFGKNFANTGCAAWDATSSDHTLTVLPILEETGCSGGVSETQTIVIDGSSALSGTFDLHYGGEVVSAQI